MRAVITFFAEFRVTQMYATNQIMHKYNEAFQNKNKRPQCLLGEGGPLILLICSFSDAVCEYTYQNLESFMWNSELWPFPFFQDLMNNNYSFPTF